MEDWQDLLRIVPGLCLVGFILWFMLRKRPRSEQVSDGAPEEGYRIYTRDYDLEIAGRAVATTIPQASPDHLRGWTDVGGDGHRRAMLLASECADALEQWKPVPGILPSGKNDRGLIFLIDQSGSMRGAPMAAVAAAMQHIAAELAAARIPFEILGFSTAGWHGGYALKRWKERGAPFRPGRLCALLHIVYKAFDEQNWSDDSQAAMLNPDILRENVDGEALEWAASRLPKLPARRRMLIMVSDGAPVDDATLMYNGPSYLEWHLRTVVARLEARDDIDLGAVGIGHDVSRYYRYSRKSSLESVPQSIGLLISDILAAQPFTGGNDIA